MYHSFPLERMLDILTISCVGNGVWYVMLYHKVLVIGIMLYKRGGLNITVL